MSVLRPLCVILVSTVALAAEAPMKVDRAQSPLPVGDVRDIGGYVGSRLRANREGYLKAFDIDRFTAMVEQKRHREWWWIGEQPGKWLESAVLAGRQSGDEALEQTARAILARLVAAQEPGGYLGITDPAVRNEKQPLRGMDPYELYFTLHGLLTAYEQWNDPRALDAARHLGDYFVATIGEGKAEFWPSALRPPDNRGARLDGQSAIAGHSVHYSWEGTLLIDPMLRLHQVTGDPKYLRWSQWVVSRIDAWSGWDAFSRLDRVAEGTLGVHELQPYVHSHTFQMNFLGFLRLYQITGDPSYLRKVRGAWDDVASRQMYITGGVSVGEHYERGYFRPVSGHVVETCATMSWMQLTQYLLELTGDPKYADAIERLLANHVFASQTVDGDCYRYHTPPNGFKPQEYFHGPDCCTASGHRIVSMLPLFFYARSADGLHVNQFVPSSCRFAAPDGTAVTVEQVTKYPEESAVEIRVSPEKPSTFALHVRIPAWCEAPALAVNGQAIGGIKSGAYARIHRAWKPGDVVRLTLPMSYRWVEHDHFNVVAVKKLPGGEEMYEKADAEAVAPWALVRGPVVYALDTVWWDDRSIPAPHEVGVEASIVRAAPRDADTPPGAMGPACSVEVKLIDGQSLRARMVPFTNVGTWYRPDKPKPDRNARAYSYAVWLQDAEGKGFAKLVAKRRAEQEMIRTSIDYVIIGDERSERGHKVRGGNTGPFNGRTYRHVGGGGAISWELKSPQGVPADLVVTYWGGETGQRTFDVLVNEAKLATQTLRQDRPGEFFEVRYPLPEEALKAKSLTIRFQAHPGNTAGGVFGLRLARRQP